LIAKVLAKSYLSKIWFYGCQPVLAFRWEAFAQKIMALLNSGGCSPTDSSPHLYSWV